MRQRHGLLQVHDKRILSQQSQQFFRCRPPASFLRCCACCCCNCCVLCSRVTFGLPKIACKHGYLAISLREYSAVQQIVFFIIVVLIFLLFFFVFRLSFHV